MGRYRGQRSLYINDLCSLSIGDLQKYLQGGGVSLSDLEDRLSSPGSYAKGEISWSYSDYKGTKTPHNSTGIEIRKDRTLYIEFVYSHKGKTRRVRYDLQRRESNLLPGKYRYYFSDPLSLEPGLFGKLYIYNGDFLPRSVLQRYGLLYKQQAEGHTRRSVFTFSQRVPSFSDLKYRKRHYRGKETPFWRRYKYLSEEADLRLVKYMFGRRLVTEAEFPGIGDIISEF